MRGTIAEPKSHQLIFGDPSRDSRPNDLETVYQSKEQQLFNPPFYINSEQKSLQGVQELRGSNNVFHASQVKVLPPT